MHELQEGGDAYIAGMPASPISAEQLADLLKRTGDAHHVAFEETGGLDPEWARWYADHLRPELGDSLGRSLSNEEIAELLSEAQDVLDSSESARPWPEFYATHILARTRA